MPRYLIERTWDELDDEEMRIVGQQSKRLAAERFPGLVWEHSHVVTDEDGNVKTFCIYTAPDEAFVQQHAEVLGRHRLDRVLEIGGDVTPADFPV